MLAALFPAAVPAGDDEPEKESAITWLWPCNVRAWHHWCQVQTQWRVGMGGATGLDYAGVLAYLQACEPNAKKRRQFFDGIRAAEVATLDVWMQQRKARDKNKPGASA